jgi:DNA transposition AAA+ family ATPase
MTVTPIEIKKQKKPASAPLANMQLLDQLMTQAIERPGHLPGLVSFSGPSGFGKSTAAAYVAGKYQADYIEVRSLWTKKIFLEELARLQGISPQGTAAHILKQVVENLARSGRPLIIDEFDHAIERGLIEIVRDIYELANAAIVIIGEEKLPLKLKKWERFDGRIAHCMQAVPADIQDARVLNGHYYPTLKIKDDLLERITKLSRGSVRRIVINLEHVARYAKNARMAEIDLEGWGDRQLYMGTDIKMREY